MMDRVLSCWFVCCMIFTAASANADYAVTDLTVTNITKSSATVSWNLPASTQNITKYELTYKTTTIIIPDTNTTSYDLTGLEQWTSYYTCVTSVLIDSSSAKSCVAFTTEYDPGNYYALAAVGISVALLIVLIVTMACSAYLDAKEAARREKVSPEKKNMEDI